MTDVSPLRYNDASRHCTHYRKPSTKAVTLTERVRSGRIHSLADKPEFFFTISSSFHCRRMWFCEAHMVRNNQVRNKKLMKIGTEMRGERSKIFPFSAAAS